MADDWGRIHRPVRPPGARARRWLWTGLAALLAASSVLAAWPRLALPTAAATQQAKLVAGDRAAGDNFGYSVAAAAWPAGGRQRGHPRAESRVLCPQGRVLLPEGGGGCQQRSVADGGRCVGGAVGGAAGHPLRVAAADPLARSRPGLVLASRPQSRRGRALDNGGAATIRARKLLPNGGS